MLDSVVKLAPVFYICFPTPQPRCIHCERYGLVASHFSPFDELPHYISVLVDLTKMATEAKVSMKIRIQNRYNFS